MGINLKKYIFSFILLVIWLYFLLKETGCYLLDWAGNPSECAGRGIGILIGNLVSGVLAAFIFVFIKSFLDVLLWEKKEFPSKIEMINFILYSLILISVISGMGR